MSAPHYYVLHGTVPEGDVRVLIHTCEGGEALTHDLVDLLNLVKAPRPNAIHLNALVAGPHHPAFGRTMTDLGLRCTSACDEQIVTRAAEMLTAAHMLPPALTDDEYVFGTLATCFAQDDDWAEGSLFISAQNAALSLVHEFVEPAPDEVHAQQVTQLASAICVAMIQARAEWSQNARREVP